METLIYTILALLFTSIGNMKILNSANRAAFIPIDRNCRCIVCQKYTRAYIHHLFKANEVADEYGIGQTTRKMLNVAKDNLRTGISFDDGKHLYTSLSFRFMGDRFDRNWNYWDKYVETTYANYLVSDFSAGYRFLTQHEVSLSINNLTDENYYEKRGYNMPGRSFWIRYSFKF